MLCSGALCDGPCISTRQRSHDFPQVMNRSPKAYNPRTSMTISCEYTSLARVQASRRNRSVRTPFSPAFKRRHPIRSASRWRTRKLAQSENGTLLMASEGNRFSGSPMSMAVPIAVLADSYKATHPFQYPDAIKMVAYGEFRCGYDRDKADTRVVHFGVRHLVEQYLHRRYVLAPAHAASRCRTRRTAVYIICRVEHMCACAQAPEVCCSHTGVADGHVKTSHSRRASTVRTAPWPRRCHGQNIYLRKSSTSTMDSSQ